MPYAAALVRTALWTAAGSSIALVVGAFIARNFISGVYHDRDLGSVLVLLMLAVPFNTAAVVLCSAYRGFGQIWGKWRS